jgi:hypothetical protein
LGFFAFENICEKPFPLTQNCRIGSQKNDLMGQVIIIGWTVQIGVMIIMDAHFLSLQTLCIII